MKRFIVSLVVVVGALLASCTEEQQSLPTAGLSGTFDLVLVAGKQLSDSEREPELLFVTSADRDELRVLELTDDATRRGYIRAPNPLSPLSVPVLPRPQALTRDMRYDLGGTGTEVGGSYLYARSNGSASISVVASDRAFLREVVRLNDPTAPGAGRELPRQLLLSTGPVTAFAARGAEDGSSTLYYATREVTGARLWEVRVPAPQAIIDGTGRVEGAALSVALPENIVVSSLIVLPQAGQLAVATRAPVGTAGKSYKVDLLGNTLTELNFGGSQALQLATHERVMGTKKDEQGQEVPDMKREAGALIFGILDPSSCGGVRFPCPSGVLAVDTTTGATTEVAKDVTGFPMLPIGSGSGVPMGLTLSTNTNLALPGRLPLVGIVPLSSGEILLFDALELRPLDADPEDVDVEEDYTASFSTSFVNPVGSQAISGDITVDPESLTSGVTTNETYVLTYQGVLPRLIDVAKVDGRFVVPYEPIPGKGPVVRPGDFIVLRSGSQVCATDLVVDAVQAPIPPATDAVLTTTTPIPEDCADFPNFLVRAGGGQPLVLSSGTEEYIKRMGPGDTHEHIRPYFFRPNNYTGASEGVAVRFTVASRFTEVTPERGNAFVVTTQSQFFPYTILVDTSITDLAFFSLPGPVVEAKVGNTNYAYIAYPSADGVLQLDLELVVPSVLNSRGVFPFL